MGYYSFDLRSLLSPRTSIGFHKRLKITRGRNKKPGPTPETPDQIPGPKFASIKMVFKMQMST